MDLNKFKEHLKNNNCAESTILNYSNIIKRFYSSGCSDYNKDTIRFYFDNLKQTKESKDVTLKAFIAYSKFLGVDVELPKFCKPTRKMPDYITLEFFEKEIIPIIPRLFKNPLKVQAFMYFLAYTGVRCPSEVVNLPRSAFDLKERTVKIYIKKRDKEKWIVLPKKIIPIIKTFFMSEPETVNAFNITSGSITHIFRQLQANFPDIHMRSRLFRHSIATHLKREGADITAIMDIMGWESIESAKPYLNNDKKMIKDLYDRYVQ